MTGYDDEFLMRRVDGELSPGESAAIDQAAAADGGLAARLVTMTQLRGVAREAFPVASDPRDRDLTRLIMTGGVTTPGLSERLSALLSEVFAPHRAAVWGGLATAAFVGGVVLGPLLTQNDAGFSVGGGGVITEPGLIRVLDNRLAADGADGKGRAVGLTFQDAEGGWCRTFRAAEAAVAGLACRKGDRWAINVLAPVTTGGEVRTASADAPEAVLAAVDALVKGATVDAAGERRARDEGWS